MTQNCQNRASAAKAFLGFPSGASLVQSDIAMTSEMYAYLATYSAALKTGSSLKTAFPSGNGLANALKVIAQIMQVRATLGAKRQIFFVSMGSFDFHTQQLGAHAALLKELDGAWPSFFAALGELGLGNSVVTFTLSDFNRLLLPNTAAGSDHGWGGHQLVLGGSTLGGKVYGTFPNLTLGGPDDMQGNGSLVPTTSLSQYAATLASWFGVPASAMPAVFPLLGNFPTQNLGFLSNS